MKVREQKLEFEMTEEEFELISEFCDELRFYKEGDYTWDIVVGISRGNTEGDNYRVNIVDNADEEPGEIKEMLGMGDKFSPC